MTVKSKPYYWVECDEPGCGVTTGDLGDYSAWSDAGQAEDMWRDGDNQEIDGRHYCYDHRKPQCSGCGKAGPVDDNDECSECAGDDDA